MRHEKHTFQPTYIIISADQTRTCVREYLKFSNRSNKNQNDHIALLEKIQMYYKHAHSLGQASCLSTVIKCIGATCERAGGKKADKYILITSQGNRFSHCS